MSRCVIDLAECSSETQMSSAATGARKLMPCLEIENILGFVSSQAWHFATRAPNVQRNTWTSAGFAWNGNVPKT